MKMDENARYDAMLKEIVDPKPLWREIAQNKNAFTSETTFDGGFTVKPLFTDDRQEASYTEQDVYLFGPVIRPDMQTHFHMVAIKRRARRSRQRVKMLSGRSLGWPIHGIVASQVIIYKDKF